MALRRSETPRTETPRTETPRTSTPKGAFIGRIPRVVGAVDVGMAIQARARERDADAARGGAVRAAGNAGDAAAVAGRLVAALAQERRAHLEQVVVHRAVRVVAGRAVLLHRLVRAHERPALLHVARVAGVVDAVAHQHPLPGAAVRVVAIGTDHLALEDRVARRAPDLGALLLVAGKADVALLDPVAHPLVAGVHLVAGAAGDVARRVQAALPVDALAALVAGEAGLVARLDRSLRGLGESDLGFRPRAAARPVIHVAVARAVAARAGGRAHVGPGAVLRLADGEHREAVVLVVAARALRIACEDEVLGRVLVLCCRACRQKQEGERQEPDHLPALISLGPGPSGSVCATPKWHSIQLMRSALAFAWRACA